MGYESRIYVVEKTTMSENGFIWAEEVARFDLCVCPGVADAFTKDSGCFVFADDGNTHITEDKYGDPLKEASVPEVINALQHILDSGFTYRRFKPLLGFLRGLDLSEWDELVCLHYGY